MYIYIYMRAEWHVCVCVSRRAKALAHAQQRCHTDCGGQLPNGGLWPSLSKLLESQWYEIAALVEQVEAVAGLSGWSALAH